MNDDKKIDVSEENTNFKTDNPDWLLLLLLYTVFGLGWNNSENPKINELEKKVARLEGQMSMIGGRFHE